MTSKSQHADGRYGNDKTQASSVKMQNMKNTKKRLKSQMDGALDRNDEQTSGEYFGEGGPLRVKQSARSTVDLRQMKKNDHFDQKTKTSIDYKQSIQIEPFEHNGKGGQQHG